MNGANRSELLPSILGLCNPLLDISAYVDQDILKKYDLQPNNAILGDESKKDLCGELVKRYPVEYTAGGSAQNVMRIVAGILRKQNFPCKVMFSGCVGDDEFGSLMSKKAQDDGVIINYQISKTEPTGRCAVLLSDQGKNRSLCAFLDASQKFTHQHLIDNWDQLVAQTQIIYISGFLIASSLQTFHLLGEHVAKCKDKRRRLCLNLSAPYVSEVFGNELEKILGYVDIVFGNDDEWRALGKFKKWQTEDVIEIGKKLALEDKARLDVDRIVLITQGDKPVVVVQQVVDTAGDKGVKVHEYPCEQMSDKDVVDTNGAGDSFAGGFLSQFIQGLPIEHCVNMGSYAAREVIKLSGIAVPKFDNLPSLH